MAALMVDEEMLTVEQTAKRLQLHEETVRRWIRAKRIRAHLIGTERAGYRIPASEVERILRGERPE